MVTQEEIKEMELFLKKENKYPALIDNDGAPTLEATNTNPIVGYIGVERFMTELEAYGMEVDRTNLVTVYKKGKQMPKPIPTPAPVPVIVPKPSPEPPKEKREAEKAPEEPPVWTEAELAGKARKQLQAIARKHEDIAGNASNDEIRAKLCGTPK